MNRHDSSVHKSYFQQLMMSAVTFQEDNLNPHIAVSFNYLRWPLHHRTLVAAHGKLMTT